MACTAGSERPPENWPGWPAGKQFAIVLTHDVEGLKGQQNCRRLMQLEQDLGFVSSFNFIPEGTYRTDLKLHADLRTNGFEVGVHDLKHDGYLYQSFAGFSRKAADINRYLREWGAVGFRSGFMLNRLDWLHHLQIAYDASTFDTDPFEPQPEGTGTIFPFWVPAPRQGGQGDPSEPFPRGYVELPYTLPQDSTLFRLLKEDSIKIWKDKLRWIAEHGGMALLDTHPDYMSFDDNRPPSRSLYPAAFYREFLQHVKQTYKGRYWLALPREVAAYHAAISCSNRV